ncbi:CPBP family intramembrane glutamic endopeptidase [Thermocrinis albus]|uniref:CPBP family intramembrane glutamic endopeptidase n=1 Tax=Thermocrinis albus TaxID=136094 RepID=UPI00145F1438|nr:CPBP family intramembrane glutamic endopeptidase [Thermocrinis albus]
MSKSLTYLLIVLLFLSLFVSLPVYPSLLLPLIFLPPSRFGLMSLWSYVAYAGIFFLPFLGGVSSLSYLFGAFAEEVFFRAYLTPQLGNIRASFIFALAHLSVRFNLFSALTFFPSLFLGWVYMRTRSLPLSVLLHTLFNLLWFNYIAPLFSPQHPV